MYNNNETPIIYEDKANSSKESSGQKNDGSITLHCENGVWRPATDAEREEMQRRIDMLDRALDRVGEKVREDRIIAQSYRH